MEIIKKLTEIHTAFAEEYPQVIRLDKTLRHIPIEYILEYRLFLHESINDYLMTTDIKEKFYHRVKCPESIIYKCKRFETGTPVRKFLNDIFGARIIVPDIYAEELSELGSLREKPTYRARHVYFGSTKPTEFLWELQIWNESDVFSNIKSHREQKRSFVERKY